MSCESYTFKTHVGDTLVPLRAQLKQYDADTGTYLPMDLTGHTVYFFMEDEAGDNVVLGTGSSELVTVTDATNGEVEYPWADEDVDTAGLFFAYFVVYNDTTDKKGTFPAEEKSLRVLVQ